MVQIRLMCLGANRRGEGWVRGKGAMRLGGDGVRISRKGIVRARGVCGMECAEAVEAWASSACGAETPRTELREQGCVCGGMCCCAAAGARAGAPGGASGGSRSRGLDRLELWRRAKDV